MFVDGSGDPKSLIQIPGTGCAAPIFAVDQGYVPREGSQQVGDSMLAFQQKMWVQEHMNTVKLIEP